MKKIAGFIAILAVGTLIGGYILGPVLQGQVAQPQEIPKELTSYRDVVKNVLPAVVSIETEKGSVNLRTPEIPEGFENQIPEEFRRFFKDRGLDNPRFKMPERSRRGFGSGFIVDSSGVVMTNNHVVSGAKKATVKLSDGRKFVSKEIHRDPKTDLALIILDTNGEKLPFLKFGDSEAMEIGDRVLAFGAPFGLTGSVTSGIISAKGRSGLKMNMYEDFLQTDAAINPGNSGGPLVNLEGRVVGINAAIKSRSGGFNGVGLAVASNLASTVKDALLKFGTVRRGYLGVQIQELQPTVAKRFGLDKGDGVVVSKVFENTPASKADIQVGDVIVRLGDTTIRSGRLLQLTVASLPLDKKVTLEVVRDGKRIELPVTIEEQPEQYGLTAPREAPFSEERDREGVSLESIGVEVTDLDPRQAKELGYDDSVSGVLITNVSSGSLAANGGLSNGMLIVKIDNQEVNTAKEAAEVMENANISRGVLLQIRSPRGGTNYVLLQSAD